MHARLNFPWRALPMLASGLFATAGHAQDDETLDSVLSGGRLQAGVQASTYYTDNFFNEATTEESAMGFVVAPGARFTRETSKMRFVTSLGAEYGTFDVPGNTDDYLDGTIRAQLSAQPTLRNQVSGNAGFRRGHDPFGVNRTEDATVRDSELDLWNEGSAGLHYRYGAPEAVLNLETGVSLLQRDYTGNRSATQFLDYDATTFFAAGYYNYSPKTSALIDFAWTNYSFDYAFGGGADQREGDVYRVRTGVRWLATQKTSGDVRVGYRTRQFDAGAPDLSGIDWEIGVKWAPVPRSEFDLTTARSEQASYRADSRVIDVATTALTLKQTLSQRVRARMRLEHFAVDFEGTDRSDTIVGGGVALEYLALSQLWIVADVSGVERDSNAPERQYDRFSGYLGIRLGR